MAPPEVERDEALVTREGEKSHSRVVERLRRAILPAVDSQTLDRFDPEGAIPRRIAERCEAQGVKQCAQEQLSIAGELGSLLPGVPGVIGEASRLAAAPAPPSATDLLFATLGVVGLGVPGRIARRLDNVDDAIPVAKRALGGSGRTVEAEVRHVEEAAGENFQALLNQKRTGRVSERSAPKNHIESAGTSTGAGSHHGSDSHGGSGSGQQRGRDPIIAKILGDESLTPQQRMDKIRLYTRTR